MCCYIGKWCPDTGRLLADTLTDLQHAFLLSSQDSLFEIWSQEEPLFAGLLGEVCAAASGSLNGCFGQPLLSGSSFGGIDSDFSASSRQGLFRGNVQGYPGLM